MDARCKALSEARLHSEMHINKCLANLSDRGRPIVAECNYHGREKIYHHQPRGHVRHSQTFSRHFFFSPGIPPYRKPGGRLWPYLIITAVGKFTMTNPVGMLGTPGKSDSQTFSRNFFFFPPYRNAFPALQGERPDTG